MKTSILIVTYRKDIDFAIYCFASIAKFARGFHELVIVVPTEDVPLFSAAATPTAGVTTLGVRVVGFDERPGKGMLHHMVKILEGDLLCPDADAILHMDPDCLFTAPVTPADYFDGDKPVMFRQRYENFRQYDSRYSWKACVRNATGIDPEFETMCRHPSVYLRDVYAATREIIQAHTQIDWREYVLSCRNEYPQTFAEFPTLGAVAIKCSEDRYSWVNVEPAPGGGWQLVPPQGPEKMKAFWSHGGMEMINDRHPGQTARQAIEAILAGEGCEPVHKGGEII